MIAPAVSLARWPGSWRLRIGVSVCVLLLIVGLVSIAWTPYPVGSLDIASGLAGPGPAHWLGTDQVGRDLLSLSMKAVLTSVVVSAVAVVIGAAFGLPLGIAAARWPLLGGRAVGEVGEILAVFPAIVLAMLMAAAFGPSLVTVMVAAGVASIPAFSRAASDGLRAITPLDYVAAARLAGTGRVEVFRRHVLPGLGPVLLATALAQLAFVVLAEASLGFVGLGAQPPATSFGLILRDGQSYAAQKPELLIGPGLVLVTMLLALNAASGGVRQLLDTRLRRIGGDDGAA